MFKSKYEKIIDKKLERLSFDMKLLHEICFQRIIESEDSDTINKNIELYFKNYKEIDSKIRLLNEIKEEFK